MAKLCKGCSKELVLCPHCGGNDDVGGGEGQDGYYICTNENCSEYEFCCGC